MLSRLSNLKQHRYSLNLCSKTVFSQLHHQQGNIHNRISYCSRTYHNFVTSYSIINNENKWHHNHHDDNDSLPSSRLHQLNQTRHMGRKDGHSAFFKPRPPTRKKRKIYHKRKREEYQHKVGRHAKPGSKAGPRREFYESEWKHLVDKGRGLISDEIPAEELEYNYGDALVDDLFGNSEYLTSSPTPKPVHMGKQYEKHHSLVSGLMETYNAQLKIERNTEEKSEIKSVFTAPLPTDKQISLFIMSYRDRNSTKSNPIGIVKALKHLVVDLKVPTNILGKRSYAALMKCSASPTEARRIMQMMEENGHPPEQYAYSILVDIHAKLGDFRRADEVLSEMRYESVEPTLAAYTSLLAGCYKVMNTASMPQSIKAEAGVLAWDKWKELYINDLKPDVMAYGSIIRIMAARGLPERAINIIEEMQMMQVKPTTLIFTSALRAVSRSHANALRFEGGYSTKHKRRESIASHHGKLTRNIVILAEQAEVEQDDGFVSALMLCAATAGDAATTKAIYLASEVRKLDHLRTIGSNEHLLQLQGIESKNKKNDNLLSIGLETSSISIPDGNNDANNVQLELKDELENSLQQSNSRRENKIIRKDTRKLSALLRANANAVNKRGLGNLWQGVENKGFLCANSLRLIMARYQPKYVDKSIPGMSGTDSGLASMVWDDDEGVDTMSKRLRREKFKGLIEDTEDNKIDELDPTLYRLFVDDDEDGDEDENDGSEITMEKIEAEMKRRDSVGHEESHKSAKELVDADDIKVNDIKGDISTEDSEEDLSVEHCENDLSENDLIDEMITEFETELKNQNVDKSMAFILEEGLLNESLMKDVANSSKEAAMIDAQFRDKVHNMTPYEQLLNEDEENTLSTVPGDEYTLQEYDLDENTDELDILLHGMPSSRIKKVRKEFASSIGDPSMIRLVPLLRENLPDAVDMRWLREKNVGDALVVMDKAEQDGVVDIHILNSMLQVLSNSGRIDDAIAFYEDEYALKNLDPTRTSDRTVFQMLVNESHITKALTFKEKLESKGKHLDLLSYGSLIEYFGNHGQIGSAILALKECNKLHGSPPGEKNLKQLRIKCRQQGLEEAVNLEKLIGKDPLDWLREGESKLKREYSKKGRSNLHVAANKLLHI